MNVRPKKKPSAVVETAKGLGVIVLVTLAVCGLFLFSCGQGFLVGSGEAVRAAEAQGFSRVRIVSAHRLAPRLAAGCSKSDDAGFRMTGVNPAGRQASFTVCCGWPSKGCTIRY